MKKLVTVLSVSILVLFVSCEKECTSNKGTVTYISPDFDPENPDLTKPLWVIVKVKNECSGNEKELRLNSNLSVEDKPYYNYESNGDVLTLDKPW